MDNQPFILVVDDEPDNFDVIETLLFREGYDLNYASNGHRAIARLKTIQPDVILLDVMMPDLDGIEVCKRIKANSQWQHIPIIMVTALTAKEDLVRCMAAGADDFISKPVNGSELRARVNSMLRIKHQHDKLQTLLQLREDMVKMVLHDMRNPLTSILLATEILLLPDFPIHKQPNKINQIISSVQHLQSLIDDLLLMAKLESGKMMLNFLEIDLNQLCLSALTNFEAIADQKNLRILSELTQSHLIVNLDALIFRRVIDNLLSNAIKFSPKNSQVILRTDDLDRGGVIVEIADSGSGVTENLKQVIFEKYEVGTLMPEVTQLGLGLAFCKMAVEAHGGKITVKNNQPKGAVFTVFLPKV
ncbi:hybrid sensor histidine kinase/response regulator [Anabaena sp. UHCC 0399]|uniref:hybrid sensor histidine kinase/response regulator n=1 Tax=Anabaena sp. UHCC 0399 TaxID=3110238 RepID=UPI002B21F5B5|nr:hybrid sensor histidine kinase/response regulator [Anabaena sp. UHCC 0399]MEA5565861.1 hybrid sensor histidine kinase/response regulator [Anabaena sp. UHCC 0399]